MHTFNLRDIITETFQDEIQSSFSLATGFGVVFTDDEGRHIGPGGNFCKFCDRINATEEGAHCCAMSNKHAIEIAMKTKKPCVYICHAGLVNIEIPLVFDGHCVGAITAGQVICSEENSYPKDEAVRNWLEDPELKTYYDEIIVMDCRQIEAATTALSTITNYIIQSVAYTKMQEKLAHRTEELLKAENRRIELEKQLNLAQLDALQKQVTPHFIFNVINSISRLLSLKEYGTAEQMLSSFAQMMRYSLADLKSSVTLQQELEYIRNYLAIQNIRFGDRIRYEIVCDERLKDRYIPFFSLQPLVENSIKHGLLCKAGGGKLKLQCRRMIQGDEITIEDNGIGIDTGELQILSQRLYGAISEQTEHVGLYNCYKRLYLMFGEKLSFQVESRKEEGTRIIIMIREGM